VRTLVQRGQASRLVPCGTASSCLSLPDAWITEPATDPSWSGHVFFAESCIQGQFGSRVDKTQADPDVIRTRSLLIWSQTAHSDLVVATARGRQAAGLSFAWPFMTAWKEKQKCVSRG